jgi:DNA gyrase subunit B
VKVSEVRWQRFVRGLTEFEGWLGRLRADFGHQAAEFVVQRRLVEREIESPDDVPAAIEAIGEDGYELAIAASTEERFDFRAVEKATGAAQTIAVPVELLGSPVYANMRRAYGRLSELMGRPPFTLTQGKTTVAAETFGALREQAIALAKEGIQLSRFKGLGEMNADELRETTMERSRRLLIRVEVEDDTAADAIFSRLMGDQVEPRREFIEQNAKDVRFLDV